MVKTPPQGPRRGHPPRLRQKRRMRENCRKIKRCKRRQLGPEDSEEQARTPAKQLHSNTRRKMQPTATARSTTSTKAQTEASNARKLQKRCKRRPVVPEGSEEQARTPAKQQKMQTTVTARSRRKQPATHLKEPQPKHPGEPRKSSAAQATHGIACKRAAEPPKRHGSRRKPPAHQKTA